MLLAFVGHFWSGVAKTKSVDLLFTTKMVQPPPPQKKKKKERLVQGVSGVEQEI